MSQSWWFTTTYGVMVVPEGIHIPSVFSICGPPKNTIPSVIILINVALKLCTHLRLHPMQKKKKQVSLRDTCCQICRHLDKKRPSQRAEGRHQQNGSPRQSKNNIIPSQRMAKSPPTKWRGPWLKPLVVIDGPPQKKHPPKRRGLTVERQRGRPTWKADSVPMARAARQREKTY